MKKNIYLQIIKENKKGGGLMEIFNIIFVNKGINESSGVQGMNQM